jgi:hypothetical protein
MANWYEEFGKIEMMTAEEFDAYANALQSELEERFGINIQDLIVQVGDKLGELGKRLLVWIFTLWMLLLEYALPWIGQRLGELQIAIERGKQEASKEFPISLPDPGSLTQAWYRDKYLRNAIDDFLSRHGFNEDAKEVFRQAVRNILDVSSIVDAYVKGRINREEAADRLEKHGLCADEIDILLDTAYSPLAPGEILNAWFRGLLTDDEAAQKLAERGYRAEDIALLMTISWTLPSITDLLRMMVREAFSKDVIEKYGYDEEYPQEVEQWLKMQGMDPAWGIYYWRAHWELPSPTELFEMRRRCIVDDEDMDYMLRVADYPKYWRERMLTQREQQVTDEAPPGPPLWVELPTRIDIRRMYDMGVIDREGVKKFYTWYGYRGEVLEAITDFTIIETIEEERNKMRNRLLESFELGIITEDELRRILREYLHYNEDAINVVIETKKLEIEQDIVKAEIDIVKEKFMEGVFDFNQAVSELAKLGIATERIPKIVRRWEAEKLKRHKRLTLKQLEQLYRKGIIDLDRVIAELQEAGYTKDDAEILAQLVKKGGELE